MRECVEFCLPRPATCTVSFLAFFILRQYSIIYFFPDYLYCFSYFIDLSQNMRDVQKRGGYENAEGLKEVGDGLCRKGQYEDAISKYRTALFQMSNTQEQENQKEGTQCLHLKARILSNLSLCLLNTGDAGAALEVAKAATTLRPRWAKPHIRAAGAYQALGQHQSALDGYERAALLDEEWSSGHTHVASLINGALQAAARSLSLYSVDVSASQESKELTTYDACLVHCTHAGVEGEIVAVAVACSDGTVRVCNASLGLFSTTILKGHTDAVTTVRCSPDGKYLASGSLDATARLWSLVKSHLTDASGLGLGEAHHNSVVLRGHSSRVSAVEFFYPTSPNSHAPQTSHRLATASTDHTVRIWEFFSDPEHMSPEIDPARGAQCLAVLATHTELVSSISISPCYSVLVAASGDTKFSVWNILPGECGTALAHVSWESGPVLFCGFLPPPASPLLLTAHAHLSRNEARILLWDVVERKQGWVDGTLTSPVSSIDGLRGRPIAWDAASQCRNASKTTVLIAVLLSDGSGGVWELNICPSPEPTTPCGQTQVFQLFSFSPSILFDTPPPHHTLAKGTVAFSKGGEFLAISRAWVHPPHIEVWEVDGDHEGSRCTAPGGAPVIRFAAGPDAIRTLLWNGQTLVSLGRGGNLSAWGVGGTVGQTSRSTRSMPAP